jgi:transposase
MSDYIMVGCDVHDESLLLRFARRRQKSQSRSFGNCRSWTGAYRAWLRGLVRSEAALGYGARMALLSLLAQLEAIEEQIEFTDGQVEELSLQQRYAEPARQLQGLKGVGVLTAMVFLTEMGDLGRFSNRRQIGACLGLVPSSDESSEGCERKGHITGQGSARLRRVLCQATRSRVRTDACERVVYERICAKNPKHKKIAVVAIMCRRARAGCGGGDRILSRPRAERRNS